MPRPSSACALHALDGSLLTSHVRVHVLPLTSVWAIGSSCSVWCSAAPLAVTQVGMRRLPAELWWNLDGDGAPCALRLLPLLAEELAPGSKRWVCAGTRARSCC